MKVVLRVARTREWKRLLVAPYVVAHDEETNRRTARILVFDSLQRVVEPLQHGARGVQHRVFAEDDVANLPRGRGGRVRPWTNDQTLTGASFGGGRLLLQAGVVFDRTFEKQIVPAGAVQSHDLHLRVMIGDAPLLPIRIVSLVRQPVAKIRCE